MARCKAILYYGKPTVIFNGATVAGNDIYLSLISQNIDENRKFLNKRVNRLSDGQWRERNFVFSFSCCRIKKEKLVSCNFHSPTDLLLDWWLMRQLCSEYILMLPEELVCLSVSKTKIGRLEIHPFYKEILALKGNVLSGYVKKDPLTFDRNCISVKRTVSNVTLEKRCMAVLASFNIEGIVFVSDNPVIPSELKKIKPYVFYIDCKRHGEYDFGSYKKERVCLNP